MKDPGFGNTENIGKAATPKVPEFSRTTII